MKFGDFLEPTAVKSNLTSQTKQDVLIEIGTLLSGVCPYCATEDIVDALVERERLATTGIGHGVAIPHAKIDNLQKIVGALGISPSGIPFDATDNQPVHIFAALLAGTHSTTDHLKALAHISSMIKNADFVKHVMNARDDLTLFEVTMKYDEKGDPWK